MRKRVTKVDTSTCSFPSISSLTDYSIGGPENFLALRLCHLEHLSWDSVDLLQGSFGPFRPKVEKRVRKCRPVGPVAQKVENGVEKESKWTVFTYFDSFSTPCLPFWAAGPRGTGNSFLDSFSNFGPEVPK